VRTSTTAFSRSTKIVEFIKKFFERSNEFRLIGELEEVVKGILYEALDAKTGYIKSLELESDEQRNIISTQSIKIERLETYCDEQKEAATKIQSEI
jgi:hypothetical protein